MNPHSSQLGFTDYVAMVWRRRAITLFAAALFACVTFIAFNFVPRKYASTCIFERRGNTISARTGVLPESFSNLKPLLSYHLTGPDSVRRAMDDLGYLDSVPRNSHGELTADGAAGLSRTIGSIRRNLHLSWIIQQPNLDRLSLRLTSRDPEIAQALPNQLVANYIASTRTELMGQLSSSATYLRQQVAETQATGDQLRERRYNFLRAHPDMMPGNPQHLSMQIERTAAEIEDIRRQRKAAEARLGILRSLDTANVGDTTINPDYVIAVETLQKLQRQLEHHRTVTRKTNQHPKVVATQQQIAQVKAELQTTPHRIAADALADNPLGAAAMLQTEDVRGELDRLAALETRKYDMLQRYNKAQTNFMPVAREYEQLSAQIDHVDKEKRRWQSNLSDVDMALAAERSGTRTHLEVVRAAGPIYRPVWPALWHVFALALGGGLTFGITLVIVIARLSRGFSSAEEARGELGLPVLGVIGPILTPSARRLRAVRRYVLAPATAAVLLMVIILAAAGVVMSTHYPERYARILEHMAPTTRAMWQGVQDLLGLI